MAWVRGVARAATAFGMTVAAAVGCGGEGDQPREGSDDIGIGSSWVAVDDSPIASQVLRSVRERFSPSMLPESAAERFVDDGTHLLPRFADGADASRTAQTAFAKRADGAFVVRDEKTGATIQVVLEEVRGAEAEVADGYVVYRGALADRFSGGDVVHRVRPDGAEDYVMIEQAPSLPELSYGVSLGKGIEGLRLVENVLEFVDADNGPRLRMDRPWLVDAKGERHAAHVGVSGCAFDDSPAAPWGRDVTPPGARSCKVIVSWDAGIEYPALLDPAWTTVFNGVPGRSYHTATAMGDVVLVVGGTTSSGITNNAMLYDSTSGTVASTSSLPAVRWQHAAAPFGTLGAFVCGGCATSTGTASSSCWFYTASGGTWSNLNAMNTARARFTLTSIGQVVAAGGKSSCGSSPTYLSSAEWRDGANFVNLTSMGTARAGHGAAAVRTSYPYEILFAGGGNPAGLSSARILRIASGQVFSWVSVPNMSVAKPNIAMASLPTGTNSENWVFTFDGGVGERLTPATYLWTAAPAPPVALGNPVAAELANSSGSFNSVLVVGSQASCGAFPALAPTAAVWTLSNTWRTAATPGGCHSFGAAVAVNGGVFVSNGQDSSGVNQTRMELFKQMAQGSACSGDGDCYSGYCRDGYCCNTACTSTCQACSAAKKGSGSNGTCGSIAAGTDPDFECPVTTCRTGECGGSTSCQLSPTGTQCGAPSCASGAQTTSTCDSAGTCATNTTSCGVYTCNTTGTCYTSCSSDSHCVGTHYCSGSACVVKKTNGTTCTGANQCQSGFCVDGYCCNSACGASCQACSAAKKGSGSNGICGNVAVGTDPDGNCTDQGAASCNQNGQCDGAGACQLYPSGTVCQAPSCSGSTLTTYACSGSCLAVQSSCAPYLCGSATACSTSCTSSSQCLSTHYCAGSVCLPKQSNGSTCSSAGECTSGFCVDGVCCDSACSGLCKACSAAKKGPGGGVDGECGNIVDGVDPDSECAASSSTTCAQDGQCNGAGLCRKWAYGTSCGASQCVGNTATGQICDGNGNCINNSTGQDCAPQLCVGGQCAACAGDTQCVANHFCDNGTCKPKQADGAACTAGSQCTSGFCVDGVCCNTQCSGLCQACSAQSKGGGNDGECGPVASGIDPDDDCPLGTGACDQDGQCNGAGACRLKAAGTPCPTTSCVGNAKTQEVCNGLGACVTGTGGTDCAPFVCSGGQCTSPCVTDSHCVSGYFCDAGSCVQKLSSGSCTAGNQCTSGFCVDGVCCNTQCSGLCQACSSALKGVGADGDCGPIQKGFDPQNECSAQSGCGQDGMCNGSGACDLVAAGVACGTTVCAGNSATGQVCNGSGACVNDSTGTDCTPFLCKGGACANPCIADGDCISGYYCNSGACTAKGTNGDSCASNSQCTSGFCADGVCCNALCTSPCMACAASLKESGLDGECGPAKYGLDPHNDCPDDGALSCQRDGQCDGTGKCRLYPQGVACGATSCVGNTVKGKICDGIGTCITDTNGVDCIPYLCQAGGCATTCQNDSECLGNNYCNNGLCDPKGQPGDACAAPNACASGFCVDDVCCDAACNGQCEACDVTGSEGQCSTVSGPPHGSRPACAGTGACQGQCDGTDPTKCSLPGSATECAAASCSGDVSQPAGQCDGAGSCTIPTTESCLPYACDDTTGTCKSACLSDQDCGQGSTCDTSTGKCAIAGATCKDAYSVLLPNGQEQSCEPYRCVGGACLDACATTNDCAPGYACEAPTCVPVTDGGGSGGSAGSGIDGGAGAGAAGDDGAVSDDSGGCGCRVPSGSEGRGVPLALAALLAVAAVRRRRKLTASPRA